MQFFARNSSSNATASAAPSSGAVPVPISSTSTSDCGVAACSIDFKYSMCAENVERSAAIESPCESRACKHAVQFRDRLCGGGQRPAQHLQTLGQLAQDTHNLRGFLFRKLHKLIVRIHRFERFQKNCLPRSAG